ncbi:type II secretion system protein [Orenia marismortui]|uniref:type II secretion system protein n=1 Tax=Orenia marismortui TaxID=46469 RepID=UPI00036A437C|nr:type II secretion system protein [Orenia marismortui]
MNSLIKREEAYTLIEILLAVSILSVALISMMNLFGDGFSALRETQNLTADINSAQKNVVGQISADQGNFGESLTITFPAVNAPGTENDKNQLDITVDGGMAIARAGNNLNPRRIETFLPNIPVIVNVESDRDSHVFGDEPDSINLTVETRRIQDGARVKAKLVSSTDVEDVLIESNEVTIQDNKAENITLTIPSATNISALDPGTYQIRVEVEGVNQPFPVDYIVKPVNYVLVGDSGTLITSNNGQEWKQQSVLDEDIDLNDIIYGGPLGEKIFVAVGEEESSTGTFSGIIMTSDDGVNWEKENDVSVVLDDIELEGIAWGGSRFVAVGSEGTIISSSFDESSSDYGSWSDDLQAGFTIGLDLRTVKYIETEVDDQEIKGFVTTGNINDGSSNILIHNFEGNWKSVSNSILAGSRFNDIEFAENDLANSMFMLAGHSSENKAIITPFTLDIDLDNKIEINYATGSNNELTLSEGEKNSNFNDIIVGQETYVTVGNESETTGGIIEEEAIYYEFTEENNWQRRTALSTDLPIAMADLQQILWGDNISILSGRASDDEFQIFYLIGEQWQVADIKDKSLSLNQNSFNVMVLRR